ncbi:sn-glycerol-3-phosphate ABC transporter permease UgpA [Paracoccus fistulariae]|uniref:sn-glycerol-3-phosphate transport system permease protein UgpA n=1 Tax=Paracoccus fistulariae TaxID=658446 RepID=A0ABY7SIX7_9RHOB|nr:sn-glycerol-3-phosphate ABC transporter permease UgpA [Paracoccus fistulariae]MDB6180815.1 sn-glycerol-3-phosphate ABC transporter permease UgpA [Paracoccus fistulariae]WCR06965.1 sn-glycerol-3-phosphate ABC transporter permease UgpA [Paracoccus fistulariae]
MKKVVFNNKLLPLLLLAPQLIVTAIFFLWPAGQAVWQSFLREDAFGLKTEFIGLGNYKALFKSPEYLNSFSVTLIFTVSVTVVTMVFALLMAVAVDRLIKSEKVYTTLLIWPYAVAPAVAGILWWFIFNPSIGILPYVLRQLGINFNWIFDPTDAMIFVVIASAWSRISYSFLFFIAGLQSIPASLREAAAIDGAGPVKRFFTITLPLLSPTTFFLMVVNLVYALFETFAVIDATTLGGPAQSTNILVYKVYQDGFIGQNLGSSAAQSVILMAIVILLTVIQFRFVEKKVAY